MAEKPLKFIADAMLGRLAKWLRILGYDVLFDPYISDDDLIAIALKEKRIILTMDRELANRESARNSLCIRSPYYKEQLKQVVTHFKIDCRSGIFTRCLQCNVLLDPVNKGKISERIPPYVYATQDEFVICPRCQRIYWSGTHRVKMLEVLEEMLK